MYWEQKIEYAALSDIGFRRRNNQDSYAIHMAGTREQWVQRGHLFLVADGMGGHAVGELASKIAADTIPHTYDKLAGPNLAESLREAVEAGNAAIHARGELNKDFLRMGTTCTTLVLCAKGALVAHVGDSRAYRVRDQRIEQLTFDHSLQWELMRQGLYSAEEILRREPRNVITRSLGPTPRVEVDVEGPYPARPGDCYLLCSDGLSGLVRDEEIGVLVSQFPPAKACRALINLANLRGGPDNITAVVIKVGAAPPELPPDPEEALPEHAVSAAGWARLASWFAAGLALVAGGALMFTEHLDEGVALLSLAAGMIALLVVLWLRSRALARKNAALISTTPGTPYRTASARLTPEFVASVAALESSLQGTAIDEGWSIDWKEHNAACAAAKKALEGQQYAEALGSYLDAIQLLMSGIHQLRRQKEQLARLGQKPAEPGRAAGASGGKEG
jgi:protein phosphatase